jgi:hypothetical protein
MTNIEQDDHVTDKDYSLSRAALLTEGFKGLLLVNGGGAVALLAFLQAIWLKDKALANAVLVGIGFMCVGLTFALLVPFFRYHHSHLAQKKERKEDYSERKRKIFFRAYVCCQYLSIISFIIGTTYLVVKGWEISPIAT